MVQRFVSTSLALASLGFVWAANAAPPLFQPKMSEPNSYKDYLFGIDEVKKNIADDTNGLQCGGWVQQTVTANPDTKCSVRFTCGATVNSCNGYTGFAGAKQADGTIEVCASPENANPLMRDYIFLHELTHAKQACDNKPFNSRAACCTLEGEAYQAQFEAAQADGLFDTPSTYGIRLDIERSILWGQNATSCAGWGPNACGVPDFDLTLYGEALLDRLSEANVFGSYPDLENNDPRACSIVTNQPTDRMQALIDSIDGTNNASADPTVGIPIVQFASPMPDGTNFDTVALPGRQTKNPLANTTTGVGSRDVFKYPESSFGYISACDVVVGRESFDADLERMKSSVDWVIATKDGSDPQKNMDPNNVVVDFKFGSGTGGMISINPQGWCTRYERATPAWCEKLVETHGKLSTWLHTRLPNAHPSCGGPKKRYCTDFTQTCVGSECRPNIENFRNPVTTCLDRYNGDYVDCVVDEEPDFSNKLAECAIQNGEIVTTDFGWDGQPKMASFYRHYGGQTPGSTMTVYQPWDPSKGKSLRAECYEYYQEAAPDNKAGSADPKLYVTSGREDCGGQGNDNCSSMNNKEKCEFVLTNANETPEWKPDFGRSQKENIPTAAGKMEGPRDTRTAMSPWETDTKTNLSMIDTEKLRAEQRSFEDPDDLTNLLTSIIPVKQKAAPSLEIVRTDSFDDTDHRAFSAFWEKQQKILLKMVRDPAVRLIMPARFLLGLDQNNPFFQYVSGRTTKPNGTVEVTLRAGLEDLGNALEAFRRSYVLPIREVRIPILVPLQSEHEINTRIAEWEQWKHYVKIDAEERKKNASDSAKTAIDTQVTAWINRANALIDKLKSYRDVAAAERELRSALPSVILKLYEPLRAFDEFFASWFEANTKKLQDAANHSKQRQQLKRIWRHIQTSMLQADACQLQWCSNQRFTAPVYSLLDSWWGDRKPDNARNATYVPPYDLATVSYTEPTDHVYDFSNIEFSREELKIPVLWPIQVKLRLPLPPLVGSSPEDPENFPYLPELPKGATVFSAFPVPELKLPNKEVITLPTENFSYLESAKEKLREFRTIIDGKSVSDQIQQGREEDANNGIFQEEGDGYLTDPNRKNMRGAYCAFARSILVPPNADQERQQRIVHVENDLRERATRLFSRWLPERHDDYDAREDRIDREYPAPSKPDCKNDVLCSFLLGEKTTKVNWRVFFGVNNNDYLNRQSFILKTNTLPTTEEHNPYLSAPLKVLNRLFQDLPLPIDIDLRPPQ